MDAARNVSRRLCRVGLLFLLASLALPGCAQQFVPEQVVFPITTFDPDIKSLSPVSLKFGTGFCLDPDCRFVGTNYHVAKLMGRLVRIKGIFSAHRYLASDAGEAGAQEIQLAGGGSLKFNPAHDLAIYEMRHPLKRFHGAGFELDDVESGNEADIYAFPFNGNPKRGLVRWHAKCIGNTRDGLIAFRYEEGRVRGGASGGIVVDSKSKKIVGILSRIGDGGEHVAFAVPARELADFVRRVQPYLQVALFPKTVFISPVSADLYPPYVWPHGKGVSDRPKETPEVANLRGIAQHLADSMRNFSATQTFAWGHDNREPDMTDAYETTIIDGMQRWHRAGAKKIYDELPIRPENGVVSGWEWSVLPEMVGTTLNLKIHQAPDALMGGQNIHVFQYSALVEDKVCSFKSIMSFVFFLHTTLRFYDCHGEVWMDGSGTILRISQAFDLSGPWYRWRSVMTYGPLEKDGKRYLVPITVTTQAEHNKTYWCRALFTDYQMFDVKSRLVSTR